MGFYLILYNLVLLLGFLVSFPFLMAYLATSPKARAGFRQKLSFYSESFLEKLRQTASTQDNSPLKTVWFHAVSVGEFNAIRPLIEILKQDSESLRVVISTTTRTGQTLAQNTYPELPVFYFPYDIRFCLHRAIRTLRPDLVLLTETELWPNFIDMLTRRYHTPLMLINGRISPSSYKGYRFIKPLMQSTLSQFTRLLMQSVGDAERIQDLGAPAQNVTVAGNIKFDLASTTDPIQKTILRHLLSFTPHDTVLTLASTHSGEDQPLLEAFISLKKDFPELKLVLAPRHPERAGEIKNILNGKGQRFSLRSTLCETNPNQEEIVVLDTIGELETVYSLSNIAVIGGSFIERGGHNPLEAVNQKIPVIFGPHMFNFPDISRLVLEYQAGFQVNSPEEINRVVTELLTQPEMVCNVVENGQRLLETNRGAKEILLNAIREQVLPRTANPV